MVLIDRGVITISSSKVTGVFATFVAAIDVGMYSEAENTPSVCYLS